MVLFSSGTEMIQNYAGLYSRDSAVRVNLEYLRHVLRKIHHHGDVAALPRQRGPATPAKERRTEFAANGKRRDYIIQITGNYDSDGYLAVARTVGGVERAAAIIETHFPANVSAQSICEGTRVHDYGFGRTSAGREVFLRRWDGRGTRGGHRGFSGKTTAMPG